MNDAKRWAKIDREGDGLYKQVMERGSWFSIVSLLVFTEYIKCFTI